MRWGAGDVGEGQTTVKCALLYSAASGLGMACYFIAESQGRRDLSILILIANFGVGSLSIYYAREDQ